MDVFESYQDGIETIPAFRTGDFATSLNLTKMELKLRDFYLSRPARERLNLTKMELKRLLIESCPVRAVRLNLTKMELKLEFLDVVEEGLSWFESYQDGIETVISGLKGHNATGFESYQDGVERYLPPASLSTSSYCGNLPRMELSILIHSGLNMTIRYLYYVSMDCISER